MNTFRPHVPSFIEDYTRPLPFMFITFQEMLLHPWVHKFQGTTGFRHYSWEDGRTVMAHIGEYKFVVGTCDDPIAPVAQWSSAARS